MTKKLEKEVSIMCNLSKGIEEIGIREGKREEKVRKKEFCFLFNLSWKLSTTHVLKVMGL